MFVNNVDACHMIKSNNIRRGALELTSLPPPQPVKKEVLEKQIIKTLRFPAIPS